MNSKQRKTLIIAGGILAIVFLFPPWKFVVKDHDVGRQETGPYRLVLLGAPAVPVTETVDGEPYGIDDYDVFHDYKTWAWEARVDKVRLSFSIGAILSVGLISFLYNADRKN